MRQDFLCALVVVAATAVAPAAHAAQPEPLGTHEAWSAFASGSGNDRICYVASKPTKEEGNYDKRGDVYAMVTHRPGADAFDEVSVHQGYTLKEGSEVEATIGSATVFLFTDDGRAWTYEKKDDRKLVGLMKRGLTMVVKGTSWRGTLTTDTYSLKGFTAAYNAISEACGK